MRPGQYFTAVHTRCLPPPPCSSSPQANELKRVVRLMGFCIKRETTAFSKGCGFDEIFNRGMGGNIQGSTFKNQIARVRLLLPDRCLSSLAYCYHTWYIIAYRNQRVKTFLCGCRPRPRREARGSCQKGKSKAASRRGKARSQEWLHYEDSSLRSG